MYRIVHVSNGPWKPGTWFDCSDGFCVKVQPHTDGGRVVSQNDDGLPLAIPEDMVMPWTVGVRGRGLEVGGVMRG